MSDKRKKAKAVEVSAPNETLLSKGRKRQAKDEINIEEVDKKGKKKTKVVKDNNDKIEDLPSNGHNGSTKDSEEVIPEKRGRKKKVNIDSKVSKEESNNGHKGDVIENEADKKKGRKKNKATEDNDEPLEELSSQSSKGSAKNKADSKVSEQNDKGKKKAKDNSNEPEEVPPSKSRRGRPKAKVNTEAPEKEETKGKQKNKPTLDNDEPNDEVASISSKGSVKDKGDAIVIKKEEKKGKKKLKAVPLQDPEEKLPSKRKGPAKDKGNATKIEVEEPFEDKKTTEESDNDNEEPPSKTRKRPAKKTASTTKKEPLKNKAATDFTELDLLNSSKTTDGKEWNLKIASWNVDGIRAWLKKGCLEYIKYEKPDILCLQEVKCPQDKLPEEIVNIPGYHAYWLCSNKDGYAGVGIYTTKLAISVKYGLDNNELDDEGRIITAEYEQFYLVSTYVPNAGRGLVTLPKRLEWNAAFLDYVKELDKKKPVIICGDMNVAHNEIDLANPKSNKKNAGFTPEERAGMSDLLAAGFVDTYRHMYPDTTGAYTFWTYMMGARAKNVGWRLDYMLVSQRLLPAVCDTVIRSDVYGSDHCPITLFLHLSSAANPKD